MTLRHLIVHRFCFSCGHLNAATMAAVDIYDSLNPMAEFCPHWKPTAPVGYFLLWSDLKFSS